MAYSDFTLETVQKRLKVSVEQAKLFDQVPSVAISPWLEQTLQMARQVPLGTEKARSEFLVVPILLEARSRSQNAFTIYSGECLDVRPVLGLIGECDFVLTATPPLPIIQAPIMTILEAKKADIDLGLGQCAAQMVGAQYFNQDEGRGTPTIFGCVTTGEAWQFLRLVGTTVTVDDSRLFVNNVGTILGVFQAIVAICKPGTAAA